MARDVIDILPILRVLFFRESKKVRYDIFRVCMSESELETTRGYQKEKF